MWEDCLLPRTPGTIASLGILDLSSVDLWIAGTWCLAGSPTSFFLVLFCTPCLGEMLSRRPEGDARSEKSGCFCDGRPGRVLLRRVSFFLFFFYLLDTDGKRSPREVAMLLREKSPAKIRWWLNEASVRLRETWLSIMRIDTEWKVTRSFDDQWEELRDFESDSRFRRYFLRGGMIREVEVRFANEKFWLKSLIYVILFLIIWINFFNKQN